MSREEGEIITFENESSDICMSEQVYLRNAPNSREGPTLPCCSCMVNSRQRKRLEWADPRASGICGALFSLIPAALLLASALCDTLKYKPRDPASFIYNLHLIMEENNSLRLYYSHYSVQ